MRASKKVKGAVLLTAGAALFLGAPTVYAASGGDGGDGGDAGSKGNNTTSGAGSLLGGLQLLNNADVNVPATVCGVGAILALGSGNCDATAGSNSGGDGGSGGNAVSTGSGSKHGKSTKAEGGDGGDGGSGGSKGNNTTSGRGSILGGLQVGNNLDANVPVTACGVGALLARGSGDCDASAGTGNGGSGGDGGRAVSAGSKHHRGGSAEGGDGGNGGDAGSKGNNTTSGAGSILGGAQVLNNADLNIPITLCGVALLAASAGCTADVSAGTGNGGGGGDGGGAFAGRGRGGSAEGGDGGDGGDGGSMGNNTTSGAGSILGGLQLLNNASVNVPVTVCGLALLGRAGCEVEVSAGSGNGGDGGRGGSAVGGGSRHTWDDDDSGVGSKHRDWEASVVRHSTKLPHTGAAGLALIPFGMALVAGGFALRRRNSGAEA